MGLRVRKLSEEPGVYEQVDGFRGVNSVWVVLRRTDLTGFSSRIFRMEAGGHTSMHSHDREHVIILVRGRIHIEDDMDVGELKEGTIVTIPSGTPHRLVNPGPEKSVILVMNLFTVSGSPDAEAERSEGY